MCRSYLPATCDGASSQVEPCVQFEVQRAWKVLSDAFVVTEVEPIDASAAAAITAGSSGSSQELKDSSSCGASDDTDSPANVRLKLELDGQRPTWPAWGFENQYNQCPALLEGFEIAGWDGSCSVAKANAATGEIFLLLPGNMSSTQLQEAATAKELRVRLPTRQSNVQCCKYTIKRRQLGRDEAAQKKYAHLTKEHLLFHPPQYRCKQFSQPAGFRMLPLC